MEPLPPPDGQPAAWQTIARATRQFGRYVRQTGGQCHFGLVTLAMCPMPGDPQIRLSFELDEGIIPSEFWPAIWHGARDALRDTKSAASWVGLDLIVIDGAFHPVDSNELSYRLATREAIRKCLKAAVAIPWSERPLLSAVAAWSGQDFRDQFTDSFAQFRHQVTRILQVEGFVPKATGNRSVQYVRQHHDLEQVVELAWRWHSDIYIAVGLIRSDLAWLTTGAVAWIDQWEKWNGRLTQKQVLAPAGFIPAPDVTPVEIQHHLQTNLWSSIEPYFQQWPDCQAILAAARRGDLHLGDARTIALIYLLGAQTTARDQLHARVADQETGTWLKRDLNELKDRLDSLETQS